MTAIDMEPLDYTRERLRAMESELRDGEPGPCTLAVAERVPAFIREVERLDAELTASQQAALLTRPVIEYVSMGRSYAFEFPYPDGLARRALSALDDALLSSPQANALRSAAVPPTGPGKADDPADIQRRIDAMVPAVVAELRAEVAERDNRIAHLEVDATGLLAAIAWLLPLARAGAMADHYEPSNDRDHGGRFITCATPVCVDRRARLGRLDGTVVAPTADAPAEPVAEEELVAKATRIHGGEGCACDPKYLRSCPRFANAILIAGTLDAAKDPAPLAEPTTSTPRRAEPVTQVVHSDEGTPSPGLRGESIDLNAHDSGTYTEATVSRGPITVWRDGYPHRPRATP